MRSFPLPTIFLHFTRSSEEHSPIGLNRIQEFAYEILRNSQLLNNYVTTFLNKQSFYINKIIINVVHLM